MIGGDGALGPSRSATAGSSISYQAGGSGASTAISSSATCLGLFTEISFRKFAVLSSLRNFI